MEHQRAFTKLTKRIAIEKTILSYRLAARELGVSVRDAKQLLAAYLASDPAKERGVTATYLLTGYLKRDQEKNGAEPDAMDLDEPGATPSSQNGANGQDDAHRESVKTKTIMIVHEDELQAKTALFAPAPASHVYALAPARLTSLALLSASALSLIRPEVREQKWKAAPEGTPAYGGIVHPDGVRKVAQGKRKAATAVATAAPKAGPSGASKPVPKKEKVDDKEEPEATDPRAVKGKGKAKEKGGPSAAQSKGTAAKKTKKDEPKIRPIGQLGGLFAKKFDDDAAASNQKKKKQNKGKNKSDSDGSDDEDEAEEEDVKPTKKTVPAKRQSTSPALSRKKPALGAPVSKTPAAAAAAVAVANKKKTPEIIMADDDDDEFGGDWGMDEEAFLEAERAAEEAVKAQAQAKVAGNAARGATAGSGAKKSETQAERQKRELEEMMKSDDMDIDEKKKPFRAPSLSRSSSSSSSLAASKTSAAATKKAGATAATTTSAPAQKSLGSFFKKG